MSSAAQAATYDWSGAHVGGRIGYERADISVDDNDVGRTLDEATFNSTGSHPRFLQVLICQHHDEGPAWCRGFSAAKMKPRPSNPQ